VTPKLNFILSPKVRKETLLNWQHLGTETGAQKTNHRTMANTRYARHAHPVVLDCLAEYFNKTKSKF
jgi:hypothetical protein